jgi:hypothetical protein
MISDIINNAIGTMQMVDYPYSTNFLGALPANPVNSTIHWMYGNVSTITEPFDYLKRMQVILNVWQNSTGTTPCTDVGDGVSRVAPDLDDNGWSYQVCNEMVMPIQSNGITDMFPSDPWVADTFVKNCQLYNGLNPQFDWALDTFGGRNPNKDFMHASNIVFTNGDLDPWRAGGLLHDIPGNDNVTVKVLEGGAHHLELRLPNDADPEDVKEVRNLIEQSMVHWIFSYKNQPKPTQVIE